MRRVVAKAVLRVIGEDVEEACGFLQKGSGCPADLEAAVRAMQQIYEEESTEGILLVDAKNAFNSLNREAALHNIKHLCLSLYVNHPTQLLSSSFATFCFWWWRISLGRGNHARRSPNSMPFYALATLPLVKHLQSLHPAVRQAWLADDSAGAGRLRALRQWWDTLCDMGAQYGYNTNSTKTWLIVQPDLLEKANELLGATGVQITTEGVKYLGSAIGKRAYVESFLDLKVKEWRKE